MSTQSWHVWNWAHVCVNPTWTIEEIFDLEAQQRGRDAGFIVHLSCYCMQPQHIIIQWLWQSLSCVWKKVETIKQLHNWNISVRVCVCVCVGGGVAPLTQTLVVRCYSSQSYIKHREFHPLLAMVTAEQSRRLDQLEVQQGLENLVPSPSSPWLPHYSDTQRLAGWRAARIRQAFQRQQGAFEQRGGRLGGVAVEDVISGQAGERALGSCSGIWSWGGCGWCRFRWNISLV